jgi:rod shape-determining protein MreC
MRPIPAEPPPFFHRGPSPLARLAFFGLRSIVLLFVDARYRTLEDVRHAVGAVLYPIQRALRVPGEAVDALAVYFASKHDLEQDNAKLRAELIAQAPAAQGYATARDDIAKLRALAGPQGEARGRRRRSSRCSTPAAIRSRRSCS